LNLILRLPVVLRAEQGVEEQQRLVRSPPVAAYTYWRIPSNPREQGLAESGAASGRSNPSFEIAPSIERVRTRELSRDHAQRRQRRGEVVMLAKAELKLLEQKTPTRRASGATALAASV
jgi:hypothetical protein